MRQIGVVTVARSDYGIYLPVLRRIENDPDLGLCLIAGGMHLSPEFGLTIQQIERDGFEVRERVEMLLSSDSPEGVAKSVGLGVIGFAQAYARLQPDILLVLGDRFEMFAAAAAALPFRIPIAHLHGGESTEGAIDEALRHSISKMSHVHFVSTETYRQRLIQMGEEPWRVMMTGAPGLDNFSSFRCLSAAELEREHGLDLSSPFLLVTYHSVTLEYEQTPYHLAELLAALDDVGMSVVFTFPNADTSGRQVIDAIQRFCETHPQARTVVNLGSEAYVSMMRQAAAMVGNSSSGVIEAASFELPVVNIGSRQRGRLHGANVIDVGNDRSDVCAAIRRAVSPAFRASLAGMTNPYGDGRASERIVSRLREVSIDDELLMKRFHELRPVVA